MYFKTIKDLKTKSLAPGVDILSLEAGGGLQTMSGTSMAAAHVTGLIARYLADDYSASPSRVAYKVRQSAGDSIEGEPYGTTDDGAELMCAGEWDDGECEMDD